MRACAHVGRVGGLAVALGVGAAVLGGTAVCFAADDAGASAASPTSNRAARADAPAGGHTATTAPTRSGGSPRGGPAGPSRLAEPAGDARQRNDSFPAAADSALGDPVAGTAPEPAAAVAATPPDTPAAAEPVGPAPASDGADPAPSAQLVSAAPDIAQPAVESIPAAEPVAAPPATASLTAAASPPDDPSAGDTPAAPVGASLDWAALAPTRRDPLGAASARALAQPTLPLIMGPSGVPIPSKAYGETVMSYYITPNSPDGALPQQLVFTPEGLYPITGVKSLPLNTSTDQGVRIIDNELGKLPAGGSATVFGYSQSAIISSLLQGGYTISAGGKDTVFTVPPDLSVSFVLVGNEMNPDGGFLSRFSGRGMPMLSVPSLGVDFYGATPGGLIPPDGGPIQTYYPTTTYIREYDGFSDFPRYPLNFLSVLNAGLGIAYVHVQYTPTISQEECARKAFCLLQSQVEAARASGPQPSSEPTQTYYFIPTENLPLLQPLRGLPLIGEPIADLLQPSLRVLVNLGYGDVAHGFTKTGLNPNANELSPFEVLPPAAVFGEALGQLLAGARQGFDDFLANFGPTGSLAREVAASPWPAPPALAAAGSGDFIATVQAAITAASNAISGAAASLYAALLPTADIINALLVALPAYDVNLFLHGVQQIFSGQVLDGLVDAVGLPLAANVGLGTMIGLVGAGVWASAIAGAL